MASILSTKILEDAIYERLLAAGHALTHYNALEAEHFPFSAAPYRPHGGIAFGLDRLVAILGGAETIRDFIAFPKNNSGRDVMIDAPATIDQAQLDELHLQLKPLQS